MDSHRCFSPSRSQQIPFISDAKAQYGMVKSNGAQTKTRKSLEIFVFKRIFADININKTKEEEEVERYGRHQLQKITSRHSVVQSN